MPQRKQKKFFETDLRKPFHNILIYTYVKIVVDISSNAFGSVWDISDLFRIDHVHVVRESNVILQHRRFTNIAQNIIGLGKYILILIAII
jgi:hypothetical protein